MKKAVLLIALLTILSACNKEKKVKSYSIVLSAYSSIDANLTIEQDGTIYTVYDDIPLDVDLHKGKVNYTLSGQDTQGSANPQQVTYFTVYEQPYDEEIYTGSGVGNFTVSGSFELK